MKEVKKDVILVLQLHNNSSREEIIALATLRSLEWEAKMIEGKDLWPGQNTGGIVVVQVVWFYFCFVVASVVWIHGSM